MELFGAILFFGFCAAVYLWDRENIDEDYISAGPANAETTRLNNERRRQKRRELDDEVARLNALNPGRAFYRDGPRIKERTAVERHIEAQKKRNLQALEAECLEQNKGYPPHQPRYIIEDDEVVWAGETYIKSYKFDEKVNELNADPDNGMSCYVGSKGPVWGSVETAIISKQTGEVIPFDYANYDLTGKLYITVVNNAGRLMKAELSLTG